MDDRQKENCRTMLPALISALLAVSLAHAEPLLSPTGVIAAMTACFRQGA